MTDPFGGDVRDDRVHFGHKSSRNRIVSPLASRRDSYFHGSDLCTFRRFAVGSGNCYANSNPVFFSRVESESNLRLYQTEMMMRQVTSVLLALLLVFVFSVEAKRTGRECLLHAPAKLFTTPVHVPSLSIGVVARDANILEPHPQEHTIRYCWLADNGSNVHKQRKKLANNRLSCLQELGFKQTGSLHSIDGVPVI